MNLCYSEHARRYLNASGVAKERTYVTGSPMAEVLSENLSAIESSDIHARLGLRKGQYILLSAHREENIDTDKNFASDYNHNSVRYEPKYNQNIDGIYLFRQPTG